jgi:hypothetical protein
MKELIEAGLYFVGLLVGVRIGKALMAGLVGK